MLRHFVGGESVQDIAKHFNRSIKTVSGHKVSAMQKLGATTDQQLITFCIATGAFSSMQVRHAGHSQASASSEAEAPLPSAPSHYRTCGFAYGGSTNEPACAAGYPAARCVRDFHPQARCPAGRKKPAAREGRLGG
ncbi:LuxR C-terminal-related transcriptional regulator [Cupriavidus basilensis]